MKWSPQQETALARVDTWLQSDSNPFFYLGGYAGTGKTTLAKHFASGLDNVVYAAYTGKAALQLQKSGVDAQTVHSLIYKLVMPSVKAIAELEQKLAATNDPIEAEGYAIELKKMKDPHFVINEESKLNNADLLVLDECSMINKEMADDLLDFGVPILVLGDPGQLPPVSGEGFFTANSPDYFLEEIHRQALDNPIIAASMHAREWGAIKAMDGKHVQIIHNREAMKDAMLTADKVMVGKNKTRLGVNKAFRSFKGFSDPYPIEGDTLICLRNYRDKGLLNGLFAEVVKGEIHDVDNFKIQTTIKTELGSTLHDLPIFTGFFDDYSDPNASKNAPFFLRKSAFEFDYGYAITVHKSQGSQYPTAFLWDDGMFNWDMSMRKKWLYTAITRASDTFIYARK